MFVHPVQFFCVYLVKCTKQNIQTKSKNRHLFRSRIVLIEGAEGKSGHGNDLYTLILWFNYMLIVVQI